MSRGVLCEFLSTLSFTHVNTTKTFPSLKGPPGREVGSRTTSYGQSEHDQDSFGVSLRQRGTVSPTYVSDWGR